jgi:hypothetical protein
MANFHFGWALQCALVGETNTLGAAAVDIYSVNLVMPGAASKDAWLGAADADRWQASNDVFGVFGDLLFPWKWQKVVYACYEKQSGTWSNIASTLKVREQLSNEASLKNYVAEKVAKSVEVEAARVPYLPIYCNDPFSLSPAHNKKGNAKSVVHAVAPLTHLPAPISAMLGLSMHFDVPQNAPPVPKLERVFFPQNFTALIAGVSYEFTLDENTLRSPIVNSTEVHVSYSVSPALPQSNGDSYTISFVARPAKTSFTIPRPITPSTSSGRLTIPRARSLVVNYAHPCALIASYLRRITDTENLAQPMTFEIFQRLWVFGLGNGSTSAAVDQSVGGTNEQNAGYFPKLLLAPGVWKQDFKAGDLALDKVLDGKRFVQIWESMLKQLTKVASSSVEITMLVNLMQRAGEKDANTKAFASCFEATIAEATRSGSPFFFYYFSALTNIVLDATNNALATTLTTALQAIEKGSRQYGFGSTAWIHRLSIQTNAWQPDWENAPIDLVTSALGASQLDLITPQFGLISTLLDDSRIDLKRSARTAIEKEFTTSLKDPPIRVNLYAPADDIEMRGYAMALQNGLYPAQIGESCQSVESAWITAIGLKVPNEVANVSLSTSDALIAHETHGATWDQGFRVVSTDYRGTPVNAEFNFTDTNIPTAASKATLFEYPWVEANVPFERLPMLGYGLYYRAAAVALDNAGGRLQENRYGETAWTSSRGEFVARWTQDPETRFLSPVAPSAPRLVWIDDGNTAFRKTTRGSDLPLAATRYAAQMRASAKFNSTNANNKEVPPNVYALVPSDSQLYEYPSPNLEYADASGGPTCLNSILQN